VHRCLAGEVWRVDGHRALLAEDLHDLKVPLPGCIVQRRLAIVCLTARDIVPGTCIAEDADRLNVALPSSKMQRRLAFLALGVQEQGVLADLPYDINVPFMSSQMQRCVRPVAAVGARERHMGGWVARWGAGLGGCRRRAGLGGRRGRAAVTWVNDVGVDHLPRLRLAHHLLLPLLEVVNDLTHGLALVRELELRSAIGLKRHVVAAKREHHGPCTPRLRPSLRYVHCARVHIQPSGVRPVPLASRVEDSVQRGSQDDLVHGGARGLIDVDGKAEAWDDKLEAEVAMAWADISAV